MSWRNGFAVSRLGAGCHIRRRPPDTIISLVPLRKFAHEGWMLFDVRARPAEIGPFLRRLVEITGPAAWQKREKDFAHQVHENPLIDRYLNRYFNIERAMIYVRRYVKNTGRIPEILSRPLVDLGALYAFAGMVARIFPRLPKSAQNSLRNKILAGLDDEVGLSPLAFEIRTAAYFMTAGFDVEFHDLCAGTGYDFLITKAEMEIEVECKSVSGDLGCRIHERRQYQLIPYILAPMQVTQKDDILKVLVVTLPDRLHANREFVAAVGARIAEALSNGRSVTESDLCTVSYHELPIAGSPFATESISRINENDVVDHCNRVIGDEIGYTIIDARPPKSATLIALRSAKPNRLLDGIYRNLREAASSQLSGTKPGIISVQFRNLTSTQLREIAATTKQSGEPSGLALMTTKFFLNPARSHIHTVAYLALGDFDRNASQQLGPLGTKRTIGLKEDATYYYFTNTAHAKSADPRYNIFGPLEAPSVH